VIRAWRLVKSKHVASAFNGVGAQLAGGRWNRQGDAAVYVSSTLSLAVLELFVYLQVRSRTALRLVSIPVMIPDELIAEPPPLPANWRAQPPPADTKGLGSEWLRSGSSCVLRAPSAIIPAEFNLVLNPSHAAFGSIEIGRPEPFSLDSRMRK